MQIFMAWASLLEMRFVFCSIDFKVFKRDSELNEKRIHCGRASIQTPIEETCCWHSSKSLVMNMEDKKHPIGL